MNIKDFGLTPQDAAVRKEYKVYVHLLTGEPYRQSIPAYSLTEDDIRKVFAHDKHAAESAIAERKSLSVAPKR